jgi:cob(I)alamin adenosyltransferase
VQGDLLSVGASLATPTAEEGGRAGAHLPPLPLARIEEMERWMDAAEEELEPLREFILPGGTEAAARLHVARTACRRAERRIVALAHVARVETAVVQYMNRLSDLLFTYARLANRRAGAQDEKWDRDA